MQPSHPSIAATQGGARTDYRVLRQISTRWLDNDVYGHINNVVYYEFIDTAVNGWLIERCGDVRQLDAIGIVAESSCRFLQGLSFPQAIAAGLRLEKLGTSSVIYQIGIFGGEDLLAAAIGRFVHVYVDAESRRPVAIPEAIRAELADITG
ncbi:MAG: thioesterase family protein [Steroidobacteraceae bacterium]